MKLENSYWVGKAVVCSGYDPGGLQLPIWGPLIAEFVGIHKAKQEILFSSITLLEQMALQHLRFHGSVVPPPAKADKYHFSGL